MGDFQVTRCTRTHDHHEHIVELGGENWTRTVDAILRLIDQGETFYTHAGGRRADVLPRQGKYRRYVQTQADGVWTNNLLALPPCKRQAAG